jgi:hypothetical protein
VDIHIYTICNEILLSLKNKDILPFETTGMNLKEIVSGKSQ